MPLNEQVTIEGKKADTSVPEWNPSEEQKRRVQYVMNAYADMDKKRKQTYAEFNDRDLKGFVDDSQKRMNAYVRPRNVQGKEDWQANFATRAYANKTKALLASTAKKIPDMKFRAVDDNDRFDFFSADIIKNLVRHSFNQGNPTEELFFLAWSVVSDGTVLRYEGFERHNYTKKTIESFDIQTGDVDFNEEEVISEGEPVGFQIPLEDLLIRNFYIHDIQEEPDIIWETYYADKERFMATWGNFENSKYVSDAADLKDKQAAQTFFHPIWKENCSNNKGYLVMRYMNKYEDVYRVIANGVELYNGPMLWSDITRQGMGKKMYPIAKTVYEPFANSKFFYGNSLPNSAMGEGDVLNTLYNTALDKTYRSMVPPMLVGQTNKDQLDLADEVVAGDTKIYVEDINQVKQMDIRGITPSDVQMIDLISNGLDLTTVDQAQQGAAQQYVTARAAVAADERARQLKGIFFMFLESLWLQMVRLRVPNILLSYTRPRLSKIIGNDNAVQLEQRIRTFNVEGAELSDGKKGTLTVEFIGDEEMRQNKNELVEDIESEERRAEMAGEKLEKVILPYGFFDELSFDLEIIPESMWQSSRSINMAMFMEKVGFVMKAFPEIFAQNKQIFFNDLMQVYNDDTQRYDTGKQMTFEQEQALQLAGGAGGGAGGGATGQRTRELSGDGEAQQSVGNLLNEGAQE